MKPTLPQGTRDFSAEVVRKRNYILNTIRSVFELYGFAPLETPAMENIETLMGKYGDEGDKLIFKILNNGLSDPGKVAQAQTDFQEVLNGKTVKGITERALRYDLTIPFARFVAINHAQLVLPFKRYQVQPVWRADKPQRGRYREFYQCDADIVGSKSLLNEVELTNIYKDVFSKLRLDVEIKVNSRKMLASLAELCGGSDKMVDITVAIDKLDKIGLTKVMDELTAKDLSEDQRNVIASYLSIDGDNKSRLEQAKALFNGNETAEKGLQEIEYLLEFLGEKEDKVVIDFTLARGLNYYTGIIFEVKANGVKMGSIGGGGRYDDLTGTFGVPNLPGVGVSFGVDRIYDVMEELQLFPADVQQGAQVLFFNLGEDESKKAYQLLQQLRASGVAAEMYHENAKFDKQFKYAQRKQIRYVIIVGSEELSNGKFVVKDLSSGHQQMYNDGEFSAGLFS